MAVKQRLKSLSVNFSVFFHFFVFMVRFTVIFLYFLSCKTVQEKADTAHQDIMHDEPVCYIYTEGTDTTFLSLTYHTNNTITGEMKWQPNGQDGAIGTLALIQNQNKIQGEYVYTIEGSEQIEEVIFIKKEGKLFKQEYELEDSNGKLIPKKGSNPVRELSFNEVECMK